MITEAEGTNAENASSSTATNATNATTTSQVPRSGLPPFAPFDPHQDTATVGQRWTKWVRRFENLLISLREFDPAVRRGLLLTYVGESTNDIFDILPNTGTTYKEAIDCVIDNILCRKEIRTWQYSTLGN